MGDYLSNKTHMQKFKIITPVGTSDDHRCMSWSPAVNDNFSASYSLVIEHWTAYTVSSLHFHLFFSVIFSNIMSGFWRLCPQLYHWISDPILSPLTKFWLHPIWMQLQDQTFTLPSWLMGGGRVVWPICMWTWLQDAGKEDSTCARDTSMDWIGLDCTSVNQHVQLASLI